jgi:DNA-binding LacI/PurR family transcriptional regulator
MSVTLKQIADELNISQTTVAKALKGKPRIGEPLRLKVQETAARMGYDQHANRGAQQLAAKRHGRRVENGAIAVVQRVGADYAWHSVPYFRSLLDGVEHGAGVHGVDLYIVLQRGSELPRVVRERRVDGLIFLSNTNHVREEIRELNLPVATLGTCNPETFSLLPDGEAGLNQATKYLIELGHKQIAYIGGRNGIAAERYKGYERALVEHGLALDENLIQLVDRSLIEPAGKNVTWESNPMEIEGWAAMELLLKRNRSTSSSKPAFTAIVCQNDLIAIGVVRSCEAAGLRVPGDLSVIGFDDVTAEYGFRPHLTSVAYPSFDIGRRAVQWLCLEVKSIMESEQVGKEWKQVEEVEYFPTTISIRDSTRRLEVASSEDHDKLFNKASILGPQAEVLVKQRTE